MYIILVGVLYGPFYTSLGLANGLVFAVIVQLALSTLYSVMLGLEDPFARIGGRGLRDSVKMRQVTHSARLQLRRVASEAHLEWTEVLDERSLPPYEDHLPLRFDAKVASDWILRTARHRLNEPTVV